MKILLFLLLTLPVYSQPPCNKTESRKIIKAVEQFKPAYKKAEVLCPGEEMILAFEVGRVDPQKLVTAAYDKLKSLGITGLTIEGRYWDRTPTDGYYTVTPTYAITTRTGSTSISTITGGRVVKRGGYAYHRNAVRAILE